MFNFVIAMTFFGIYRNKVFPSISREARIFQEMTS